MYVESAIFDSKLFSKALRQFAERRISMFNIFGWSSKIVSLHSNRKTDSRAGNVKKFGFLEIHSQIIRAGEEDEHGFKVSIFD